MEERYNVEAATAIHRESLKGNDGFDLRSTDTYTLIRRTAFAMGLSLILMFIAQNVIAFSIDLVAVPLLKPNFPDIQTEIHDATATAYYVSYFVMYFLMFALPLFTVRLLYGKKGLFRLFKPAPKKVTEFDGEAFEHYLSKKKEHRSLKIRMLPEVIIFLPIMTGAAYVMSIVAAYIESVFNVIGFVSPEIFSDEPATAMGWVFYILTLCVAAPVCEEMLFRGAFLKMLKPFGVGFAITVQALLFSLFHGTLAQLPYTLVGGLIMGYLAYRYGGILPTIILHALNNGFSVIISGIASSAEENSILSTAFAVIIYLWFVLGGIFLLKPLAKKDSKMFVLSKEGAANDMPGLLPYKAVFAHPAVISYMALQIGIMLLTMLINGINIALTQVGAV